ncbi:MAG: hypothetical protein GY863_22820 [bacterium]|nr:hypothetical protein [bacterium]
MHLTEQYYIEECKKLIEKKLNLSDSRSWKQRDYEYLSELVFEKAGVLISISTLKRIWNTEYEGMPHTGTLNALTLFLGYRNWHDFKKHQTEKLNKVDRAAGKFAGRIRLFFGELRRKDIPVYRNKALLISTISVITISFISYYLFIGFGTSIAFDDIEFSSRKVITNGVPNTVIFDYDVSNVDADSIIIQQSWDTRRRALISKDNKHHTSVYYFPGYHKAKLMIDNRIIKEHNIHITTDGWLGIAKYNYTDNIPLYINKKDIIQNGSLYISPYSLRSNNVDLSKNNYWVSFYNVQDFGNIYGDNFVLETEIKNNLQEGGLTGQYMFLTIMCQNGRIAVPLTIPGLVGTIGVKFMEKRFPGTENDLSSFGCNMSDWSNLRIEVQDRQVNIGLNGKNIFDLSFTQPAGRIIGLHYMFYGSGAVNYVKLIDGKNNTVLEDDFMYSKVIDSGHASLTK